MIKHLLTLALLGAVVVTVSGQTLSDNLSAAAAGAESATGNTWLASSFTSGSSAASLSTVTLLLANTSAGQAQVSIYSDAGYKPGALIANLVSPITFSATPANTAFIASGVSLSANTTYWVVLKALSGTFQWSWTASNTGTGAGFTHTWGATGDAGATWYTHNIYPTQMAVVAGDASSTCTYALGSSTAGAPAAGASGTVSLAAGSSCAWSAIANESWISVTAGASGIGTGSVSYTVQANTASSARSGTLTIAGQTFTVTQAAASASSCLYVLSTNSVSALAAASTGSIAISTTTGCSWTTNSDTAWLTISSAASGSGSGSVIYSLSANGSGAARSAVLTIGGQAVSFTQLSISNISCAEFSVSEDGRCMLQSTFPWIAFGGGWESRLKAGNISTGTSNGPIEVSFKLIAANPVTGGISNHLPAYVKDNRSNPQRYLEQFSYPLNAGESLEVQFLYPPQCDANGLNCAATAALSTLSTGSLSLTYLAADPAYLRNLAKAQVLFLGASGIRKYAIQASELEMSPATLWKAPVAVSFDQSNGDTRQATSAAIGNPGTDSATVLGTLIDQNGTIVTSRNFMVPAKGTLGVVFHYATDAVQNAGFGSAMFPHNSDFTGWVTFQAITPSTSAVNLVMYQNIGDSLSNAEVQPIQ